MTNPFEDENAAYEVLKNSDGQYSLWRAGIPRPTGWDLVYEAASRSAALSYVDENWRDMRPDSLISREPF